MSLITFLGAFCRPTLAALAVIAFACASLDSTGSANAAEQRESSHTAGMRYRYRLEAHNFGKIVETWDVEFYAATELEIRIALGDAQRVFGQDLDRRGVKWSRIIVKDR